MAAAGKALVGVAVEGEEGEDPSPGQAGVVVVVVAVAAARRKSAGDLEASAGSMAGLGLPLAPSEREPRRKWCEAADATAAAEAAEPAELVELAAVDL